MEEHGGSKGAQDNIFLLSQSSSIALSEQPSSSSKREFDDYEISKFMTTEDLGHAQTLHKNGLQKFLDIGPELVFFSLTFPIFALAAVIVRFDGKIVDEPDWSRLQLQIKILSTAFTYVFGLVVGRAVKLFASWKLYHGTSLGVLEQMMGSTTFGGTLVTHGLLRPLNQLTVFLLIIWTFSPLGSQLSLSLIKTENQLLFSNATIRHLDTAQPSKIYGPDDADLPEVLAGPINSIYSTSIISPDSVRESSLDSWGNVKIPYFRRLDASANSTGWTPVPRTGIAYSSLLGVPTANIPGVGNTTFVSTTTYLDLDCYNITQGAPIPLEVPVDGVTWSGTKTELNGTFFIAIDGYITNATFLPSNSVAAFVNATNSSSIPHTLLFQSTNFDASGTGTETSIAYCGLSQQYVDSEIFCSSSTTGQQCEVVSMRPSTSLHAASNFTVLGFQYLFTTISYLLPSATGEGAFGLVAGSTATEVYIATGSPPNSGLTRQDLFKVAKSDFEVRLGQALNTYYLATIAPFGMLGNLTQGNATTISGEGVNFQYENRYKVNWAFFAIFLAACTLLFIAAVGGIALKALAPAPDVLGYVSTLTRDNPYVSEVPEGGSTLGGIERSLMLKDLKLRLGDVAPENDRVGRIAIASFDRAKRLFVGRLYS